MDCTTAKSQNPWLILSVTAVGTFMSTLDASIVNVALPAITNGFQASLPLAQWVVSAYLLVISSLLPVFGRTGDLYGQRQVYITGFLVFTVSSAACGLTTTIYGLIAARVIQAIGAAMLMANAPALVAKAFPVHLRGRALGTIGSVVALGSMAGPSLGGFLVGLLGWKAIFFVNIPIGIAGYLLGRIILPREKKPASETFDFTGSLLFAVGMSSLLLIFSHGGDLGWTSPAVIAGLITAVAAFSLFIRVENRVEHPMLDLSLFHNWPFLAGNLAGLLSFMAMFSNTILMPFYLSEILKLDPTRIGLLITPFPLAMVVVAPLSGYMSERVNPALLTAGGLAITAGGLTFLATLGPEAAIRQVLITQLILGAGNGLFQSPNNNSILSSVARNKTGIAAGVNALMRNIGMVTGTALAVSIFENRRRSALAAIAAPDPLQSTLAFLSGYHAALLTGAAFAALAAIISLNRRGPFNCRP